MTYLDHVSAYFIGLVGKGVSLSSSDLAIVRDWEASGIPAPMVCRALREALQRRGPGRRTALSDLEPWMNLPRDSRPAPPPAQPARAQTAHDLLEPLAEVGQNAPDPLKEAYRQLYREIRELGTAALSSDLLLRLDERATSAALGALPARERLAMEREVARRARQILAADATQSARRRLAAALLEDQLCEKLGFVLPSGLGRARGKQ